MPMVRYHEPLYRPPSEARSLIVQATLGCSNNTCTFCTMYKSKRFVVRPLEDVLEDFSAFRRIYSYAERIFIADGDALILPMENWLAVLNKIRTDFPECKRVTCYASPRSIQKKTLQELVQLRQNGLCMVYIGLESGSDTVLKKVCKGSTAQEIIDASKKLHEAGIEISVTAINGLGGRELFEEHAVKTGEVLSEMRPQYIGLLTLMVYRGTPMYKEVQSGALTMLSPDEIMQEIRLILEHCDCPGSVFRANHASNYLPLGGTLNRDKARIIQTIDDALAGKYSYFPDWMRRG